MSRRALIHLVRLAAIVAVPAGCTAGLGSGDVRGSIRVDACRFSADSTPTPLPDGDPFNFRPTFFVGQPIDSDPITSPRFPANQMIIRIQPRAARIEDADALVIWALDSAAVARCVRGAMPGGTAEWDPLVCDRSGGDGRMLVGMSTEKVRSFLSLSHSCPKGEVSGNALGACTDGSCPDVALCPGRGSWVTFTSFGNIPQNENQSIPDGFKVNNGERIEASAFHLELCDGATVLAALRNLVPIPKPNLVGVLEGHFEFDLERGQGGQPFP